MLVRLEPREWLVVVRGVLALFVFIVAGSIVVEIQLNQLTYWRDFVQVFNIKRVADGAYLVYAFGEESYVKAAWHVGTITNTNSSINVSLLGIGISLPTKVNLDPSLGLAFAQSAWQQGQQYAFACKLYLTNYWAECEPLLHSLYQQVADQLR